MMHQDVAVAYTCVDAGIASQVEFSTPVCESKSNTRHCMVFTFML